MKRIAALFLCLFIAAPVTAQPKRPMQVDDLFKFKRVSDPQISPGGKWVAYVVATVDDVATNKRSSNLWLASTDGKTRRRLTTTDKRDSHPRWSPDGKRILFQSNRSGSQQLWAIDVHGGEATQLTKLSTGASDAIWSPDGALVAFVSAVYPEYSDKPFKESDALNKKKIDEIEKSPVKARVFKRLFFRHWDEYVEDKRQHLFVLKLHYQKHEAPAWPTPKWEPLDLTPGDADAYPTSTTFSSGVDFTFSPDGKHLLYTAPPKTDEAWSTNYDIWRVSIGGGKPENLTKNNKAADSGPQFSPDGKWLAYRAQQKPGYEADRWELLVAPCDASGVPTGKPRSVTGTLDSWVEEFVWARDSRTIFFTAEEKATVPIWEVHIEKGEIGKFAEGGASAALSISKDGNRLAFTSAALDRPPSVRTVGTARGAETPLVKIDANAELLAQLDRPRPESVTIKGAGGDPMQMWILKPPGFDPKKKWPVAYLVHGGPQGAWEDGWSFRWNPELWAAQGYVVALPNPRGSTGFGQKYIDEIGGDWGGKCYEDLMKGVDYLESLPYVDKDRIGAAGASFGGYMMDWFAVNTGRFKTLITHCSVWNFESMWGTTDELWFDEWEHGGLPWQKPTSYGKYSPHKKAGNLGKFKTPMLVIHNDLDFRCPIGQGLELFTTLQRQRVPSRMLNFPDEGHWVLKPANSRYWHQEVFAWLKKYVPPGGLAR